MSNIIPVSSSASSLGQLLHGKHILKILLPIEVILLIIVGSGFLDFKVEHKTSFPIDNLHYATQPKLKGWDDERLLRKAGETDMEYATRMNKVVGSSFYHCLYTTKENIFEIFAAYISKTANENGFLHAGRNCGFCHQAAYILTKVLNTQGIEAVPLDMNGHVCVLMKDGNDKYIFDPDYVVGPMRYLDDMTVYIPQLYGPESAYDGLYQPFATNTDDKLYWTMQYLMDSEAEQNRKLGIVKRAWYICVVGLILTTVLIVIRLMSRR